MADVFLHGVQVIEVDTGPRAIRTVRSSVIGLCGTAPDADPVQFPLNRPVLVAGSRLDAQGLDTVGDKKGTLPDAMDAIFDQIGAVVIVVRVDEGVDDDETLANIVGGVDAVTGHYEGVHAFTGAASILGFQPRIICVPGFTHQRPGGTANPVVAELVGICEALRAITVADGPGTNDADAITYRGDWGTPRVYVVDPWVSVFDTVSNAVVDIPASAHVAGIMAKIDNDRGFWWSPSNQTINGIVGTSRPVGFKLGHPNSRANLLNEQAVATIIREDGYRLWGNLTTSSAPNWQFLSVRRTADILEDTLIANHLWAVDRNLTATYYSDVAEGVNHYIRSLVAIGALIGGTCYADPDLNTPDQIVLGKASFNFDFTPPYPAQTVTFNAHLTHEYLTEVL